jgi:predicted enzyme related to lactoylglutathione lyase
MHMTQTKVRSKQGELSWVDLVASDLERQSEFYEQLFGWTHRDIPTDGGASYRLFYLGEGRVAGGSQMTPQAFPPGTPSMWNTYLYSEDVDALAGRVDALGGRVFMPPMDVMSEGRMTGVQEPSGAMVYFWQQGAHAGAEVFNAAGALVWADLSTRDPESAVEFFRALVGWDVQFAEEAAMPFWVASIDGRAELGVMQMPPQLPAEVPPHWLAYFGATDIEGTARRAASLGGTVESEPMGPEGMRFAVLSDPAGATFAIMEPVTEP